MDLQEESITLQGFKARGLESKTDLPELSFLFPTYHLNMIKPSVKFHEYIPYCYEVISQTLRKNYTTRILGKG